MHAATFVGGQAIAFRGLDDALATKYVEGSECCLIHIDNPQSAKQGVYVNPYVRVGYSSRAYESVHPDGSWLTYTDIFTGLWTNRLARWYTMPWFKEWRIRRSILTWEMEVPGRKEDGMICTINEMQVLVENGWAHV